MPDALQSLGQFFSGPGGTGLKDIATIGAAGSGLFGNIASERARSQELNTLKAQQAFAEQSPSALAAQVAGAEQPLNKALTEQVGNQVSGTLAEQGLSQAPGIQATALAQALAPFQQQNQAAALQLLMQRLGLPPEYAKTMLAGNPGNVDLSKLLSLLGGPKPPGTSPNPNAPYPAANASWVANLPGNQAATPPPDPGLPSWLTSAPATDSSFGG